MTKRSSFRYFKTSPEITRLAMMLSPPLVDHTRYICHASARLRVDANMLGLALGYAAVCLLSRLSFAEGATQAAFGIRLTVKGCRSATSTHETISSSIEPPLLLSGANY